jgi:hypothetical protein
MYLGKPVLMVPVEGHFEQHCNAIDASSVGAGLQADHFAIDQLLDVLPTYTSPAERFRPWVDEAEARYLEAIETAVYGDRAAIFA